MITVYVGTHQRTQPFRPVTIDLRQRYKATPARWGTWRQCMPTLHEQKNLYVTYTPERVHVDLSPIDETTNHHDFHNVQRVYEPAWRNAPLIELPINMYLFSEQPLDVSITSPYNHDIMANGHGFIVDARMCINEWFRRLRVAYQLFPNRHTVTWNAGDPAAYVRFHTKERITFVPFTMTPQCLTLAQERETYQTLEKSVPHRAQHVIDLAHQRRQDFDQPRATLNERILVAIHASVEEDL